MNGENLAVSELNNALQQAIKSLGVEISNEIFERPKFEGHGDRSVSLKEAKQIIQIHILINWEIIFPIFLQVIKRYQSLSKYPKSPV